MSKLSFPLQYESQQPNDDLSFAISKLQVLDWIFDNATEHGMRKETAQDVAVVLSDVRSTLIPILRFLNELDYKGMMDDYRNARREEIVSRSTRVYPDAPKGRQLVIRKTEAGQ